MANIEVAKLHIKRANQQIKAWRKQARTLNSQAEKLARETGALRRALKKLEGGKHENI